MSHTSTPGPWRTEHWGKGEAQVVGRVNGKPALVCAGVLNADGKVIAAAPDLLALAYQYRDDLLYPPTADSRERRLAAIDAVIAKASQ